MKQQVVVVVGSYIDTKLLMKKEKIEEHLKTEQPKEIEEDCTCGQADCNKCVGDE